MTTHEPLTTVPDHRTILEVMRRASRAPSVHNTQPWHWIFDGVRLSLHTDPDRQLLAADPHGRQRIISCGAALHHARTMFAAHGWHTDTEHIPDPHQPDLLAVIDFRRWPDPPEGIGHRAAAIDARRTDRLPMLPPDGWEEILSRLRRLTAPHDVTLDAVGDEIRPRLAAVSDQADANRRDDMYYQNELQWWAGHSEMPEGIPPAALASDAEFARVDIGRSFPRPPHSDRRAELRDRSALVVLGTDGESALQWLHAGEALSVVLLECTAAGLATCPLTHITELPAGRRTVASLLPERTLPQVIIRIGTAPGIEQPDPTPRRPLTETLEFRD
ncbi:nitroreductase [Nocardia sp. GAS34]|uniref:Acg family FMN-binding oxidoreductase n=1 Tax=unclassified Nocardia TaxID=2637762 RepID=UPI003D1E69E3